MRDIRDVPAEEYWDELRRRWGGLLSYRYIGAQFASMNANVTDPSVTLRRDMRNAAGGIMAAPLSICAPGGIARSDLEAVPNPVVHSLQVLDDAADVRRVLVRDTVGLHEGRRLGFSRATIVDADDPDRVIAFVESQGVSIGEVPPVSAGSTTTRSTTSRTRRTCRRCGGCSARAGAPTGTGCCRS